MSTSDKQDSPTTSKVVVNPNSFGSALIRSRIRSHEFILETIDDKMLKALVDKAKEGVTMPEIAVELGISYLELVKARQMDEDFDSLCKVLETIAVSKHLKSARLGIRNPKNFSPAAYDRVMGALDYTPHVSHVEVSSAGEGGTSPATRRKVGFDVQEFMGKHGAVIDVTPEVTVEVVEELEDIL